MRETYNLNGLIQKAADPHGFVKESEAAYESLLETIAKELIKHSDERPIILISGPSGSGKTTSCLKLETLLDEMGFTTHSISLDNYFHPITEKERPLFEAHKIDLESPDRVDTDLLNSQLRDIMTGKEVLIPRFDFVRNQRVEGDRAIKLRKGEMIILEGIHSLNPTVIEDSEEFSSGIYVSVRSRIEHFRFGESFLLHPSKIRLARRIIRDGRTRNRLPSAVIDMYDSVENGENKYIMPYKHRADFDVDTFIPYEPFIYKGMLPPSLPEDEARHPWLTELFEVLAELPALSPDLVPEESLLREFIGGGKYGG